MKILKIILYFLISLFFSCQNESSKKINKNNWTLKNKNNKDISIEWKYFNMNNIQLKVPSKWKINQSKDAWIFFSNSEKNRKLYFSIMKYDSYEIEMNQTDFLKEVFVQLSDKIDNFNYTLKKITFNDSTYCYVLSFFTKEKEIKYLTYAFIYQKDNHIYEFTYKTYNNELNNSINYRKFLLIVNSFKLNNKYLINGQKLLIKDEKTLKYEDLK